MKSATKWLALAACVMMFANVEAQAQTAAGGGVFGGAPRAAKAKKRWIYFVQNAPARDLYFTVYDDWSWKHSAKSATGKVVKEGKLTADEFAAMIAELKKAGLAKAKSMPPAGGAFGQTGPVPAAAKKPYSVIRLNHGDERIWLRLPHGHKVIKKAYELAGKHVK